MSPIQGKVLNLTSESHTKVRFNSIANHREYNGVNKLSRSLYILTRRHYILCMHFLEPEEDYYFCLSLDWDGVYKEETFGDRLLLFYQQFNSSTRALLDNSLFREISQNVTVTGLQILCKNEIIYKRLVQRHQKIGNEIRWIWPETVTQFELGIHRPDWCGQVFKLEDYWLK